MRRDLESTDVAGAAYLAREVEPGWPPDSPSPVELHEDEKEILMAFEERARAAWRSTEEGSHT